jgi:hypothetical protein
MDLFELGDVAKDQEDLTNLLLEYVDVFSPITEAVPGVEYVIQLKPDADLSKLNRPSSGSLRRNLRRNGKPWRSFLKE